MPKNIDDRKHWYDRAAEMRVIADEMNHGETQEIMRRPADDYDKLGDRAAERLTNGFEPIKATKPG